MPRIAGWMLLLLLVSPLARAQTTDEVAVRAWFDDPALLERITPLLGHAQIDRDKGLLRTDADPYLRSQLIAAGFRVEIDAEATAALQRLAQSMRERSSISGFACYRTVEESYAAADALAGSHPTLVSVIDIGPSWEATQGPGGYPMRVVRATNSAVPGPKPLLFLIGSIHAREYTPAELALRFVEDLVRTHGIDADATWILDQHEVQLLIQGNPDGRKRAESGLSWRKNTNNGFCANSNNRGIDLNRNFPFEWGAHNGSSGVACDGTYRGPSPGSEPETQAIVDYIRGVYADRRGGALTDPAPDDTSGMFIDIHSYSQLVLWPWGFTATPAPNATALQALGRRLAGFNNYTAQAAIGLYATDGTTDDFVYGELGVPSYTFELGTSFFQGCDTFENQILTDNRQALRYAARALRAPYLLPSGPDASGVRVDPDLILQGDAAQLTVRVDDARQQTASASNSGPVPAVQPIASVRAYVGTAPWQAGAVPILMQPVDGAFDTAVEDASVSLPTAGLGSGRHLVYVQGRDSGGADGVVGAAFVEVLAPQDAATLSGRVSDIGTDAPLAATLQFGQYRSDSNPVDGGYERLLPGGTHPLQVSAAGYETVALPGFSISAGEMRVQDFAMYRVCPVIEDSAELGQASPFTPQSPWQLRAAQGQDGGAAWLQSAAGNYANNLNVSLTGAITDLGGYGSVALRFDQRCDTEATYDFGIVEISSNGGGSWSEVFRCDGESAWRTVELPLPQLDNVANARLRFRFTSDGSVVRSGWALDNILLSAGGETCRLGQQPPVRIDSFGAAPAQILAGESSTLSWSTAQADSCEIGSSLGGAPIVLAPTELDAGSRLVAPAADATYTLSCAGPGGPTALQTTITVVQPPPVAVLGFSADPTQIVQGAASTLSWSTENAVACSIGNDVDASTYAVPAAALDSGSIEVMPEESVNYSLSCDGESGPASRSLQVVVTAPLPPDVFADGFESP